jgi:hypothetical protein
MSCQCYFHYYKLFENKPANLDTWLTDSELDILGGTIPSNQTMYSVTPATIALTSDGAGGKMGSAANYTVKVTPAGVVTIKIDAFSGYVAQAFVLYGDADCGNEGKILSCTFAP